MLVLITRLLTYRKSMASLGPRRNMRLQGKPSPQELEKHRLNRTHLWVAHVEQETSVTNRGESLHSYFSEPAEADCGTEWETLGLQPPQSLSLWTLLPGPQQCLMLETQEGSLSPCGREGGSAITMKYNCNIHSVSLQQRLVLHVSKMWEH